MTMTPGQMAALMTRAAAGADREAKRVVERGALEVKKQSRVTARASGGTHAPHAASHINYDMRGRLEAEIGYDPVGQGNLGTFLEFGSGYAITPNQDLARALAAEVPKVEQHLLRAVMGAWR